MGILPFFLHRKITQFATLATAGLAIAFCLVAPQNTAAQALAGINGVVTDQTGAVVPNANVTITNNATSVSRTAATTSVGTYYVTDLIPGTYTVKIEASGFKTFVSNAVYVQTATVSTVNATVQTGTTTETVEVTASPIALQTEQPQLGTTIENELVQEIPVEIGNPNGGIGNRARQIDNYLFLAPGVSGGQFSHRINGGLDFQNEVIFNGVVAVQSETQGFQSYINPPFELVNEFTVLQGAFSAQYGLSQGVAQYQFHSGTNKLHGDAFGIFRNNYFDAAGAVANFNAEVNSALVGPNDPASHAKAPVDHETDAGFSLGGPVFIPKLYEGKNKTFWYFTYDKYRQSVQQGNFYTVPTQAMVNGDFSGLTNPTNGSLIPIFVPAAWATNPALIPAGCTPGAAPGQPFPGNKIPSNCISSVSKQLLALVPQPTNTLEIGNSAPLSVLNRQLLWGFTIDHNLTTKQAIHGAWWRDHSVEPFGNNDFANPLNGATAQPDTGTGLFITYSNSLSSRLVTTLGFGWMGEMNNQFSQFPIKFSGVSPEPSGDQFLPGISFNGGPVEPTSWGNSGESFSVNRKLGIAIDNNWLYNRGRHTMNFGIDIRRSYQDDHECQNCMGNLSFSNFTTGDPASFNDNNSGNGFASFLLGQVDSANRQFAAENKLRNLYIAPYLQDNIKLTPRFTLDVGLRWDLAFPFTDETTNNIVFFDPNAPNSGAIDPRTGQPRPGAVQILGTGCTGCAGFTQANMHWNHFSPRLGFSYQLNDKTVLLAGLTFSYLDTGAFEYGNNKIANQYGDNLEGVLDVGSNGNQTPGYGLWDNKPLAAPPALPFTSALLNTTSSANFFGKDINQAYYEQFNVGVQRELPSKMFLSAAYFHSHDLHLPASLRRFNSLNPSFLSMCPAGETQNTQCILGQAWTSPAAQAILQSQGFGQAGGFFTPYANFIKDYGSGTPLARALLPFPQYRFLNDNFDLSGSAIYNAVQASLEKRFTGGLTFLTAYTLARTMSNTDSGFSSFNGNGLNQFNTKAEWAVADNDQEHTLKITGVYELPIGPGKPFLNKSGTVAKNILGGWQISGVLTYASGTPFGISAPGAVNGTPLFYTAGNRANIVQGQPFNLNWNNYYTTLGCDFATALGQNCASPGAPVFNPGKFTAPGVWTLGNSSRNYASLRNPWTQDEDIALAKKIFFGEHVTGELKMEYFNILNRMQICGSTDNNVVDSTFGIDSAGAPCQGNNPRQGQVQLKVTF